jgi:hypothetical protein
LGRGYESTPEKQERFLRNTKYIRENEERLLIKEILVIVII